MGSSWQALEDGGQLVSHCPLPAAVASLLLFLLCVLKIQKQRVGTWVPDTAAPGLVLSYGVVHSNNLIPSRYSTTEAPSQVCRNSQVWAWSPSWAQYLNNSIGSRESTSRKIVCGVSLWTQGLCFLKVTPLPPPTHLEMTEQGAKDVV